MATVQLPSEKPDQAEEWFKRHDEWRRMEMLISQANDDIQKLTEKIRHTRGIFSELAGGIAHEMNNLLTVIGGHADILLLSLRRDDPNAESARLIVDAAARAAVLTRRLTAFKQSVLSQT